MNPEVKISIVVPSFNQGKYIEETILSVIQQDYKNVELIIIDGGSTDNSVDIIKKYQSYISFWISEPDEGQTHAIVKGLEKCSGGLFNWINSDDKLLPASLSRIAEVYTVNKFPDLICGNVIFLGTEKKSNLHKRTNFWNNIPKTMGMVQMCQQGMFYKTEIIKQLGLNHALHYSMDVDLYFRFNLCRKGNKVIYLDENLAAFRIHDASKSSIELNSKKDLTQFEKEEIKIFNFYANRSRSKKSIFKIRKLSSCLNVGVNTTLSTECPEIKSTGLLNKSIDYFLLKYLLKSLFELQYNTIKQLLFRINWLNIERRYTIRVLKIIVQHGKFAILRRLKFILA